MRVLSLFDGIACARVVLDRAGIPVDTYYASEICKHAITIAQKNYPDIIEVGDVRTLKGDDFKDIDLLIGGSPCQDLSIANKYRKGLEGEKSGLFWEYVRILREVKPRYFVLENVASMSKDAKRVISETLKVEPIMINAALVSAQSRKRLFWTNIPDVRQPADLGIRLRDILEPEPDIDYSYEKCILGRKLYLSKSYMGYLNGGGGTRCFEFGRIDKPKPNSYKWVYTDNKARTLRAKEPTNGNASGLYVLGQIDRPCSGQAQRVYSDSKSVSLQSCCGGGGGKTGLYLVGRVDGVGSQGYGVYSTEGKSVNLVSSKPAGVSGYTGLYLDDVKFDTDGEYVTITPEMGIRRLSPIECERLQGLPDRYTEGVSRNQRYKALGNAFNVDVVAHILRRLR